MHTAAVMDETSQLSVRHLPLAQLEAVSAAANVAQQLRKNRAKCPPENPASYVVDLRPCSGYFGNFQP